MDFNCKLEILTDNEAVYEDDFYYDGNRKVRASVGGDKLMLRTVVWLSDWVGKNQCRRNDLTILGLHLYNIAFRTLNIGIGTVGQPWPLEDAFKHTYETFEQRRKNDPNSRLRLMLLLHKEAKQLSTLPWEFIFIPRGEGVGEGFFLAGQRTELILTRFVPGDPTRTFQTDHGAEKLRILIVLSTPRELGIVDAKQLIEELYELRSQQITVELCEHPTRRTLPKKLKCIEPHIVHFIGHGEERGLALMKDPEVIEEAKAVNIGLMAERKDPLPIKDADWLDSESVSGLFDCYIPRLVFLHACKGAAPGSLARSLVAFGSTALDLAYTKIPAVIAMQYEISNEDAERFARKFYDQIGQGKHIDEAVGEARRELGTHSLKGRQAWDDRIFGTPVIYLQSQNPIIQPPPVEIEPQVTKVPCPYPACEGPNGKPGMIIPGKKFCLTCKKPLMLCPNSKCQSVVAKLIGLCDSCGQEWEMSTQSASNAVPAATVEKWEPKSAVNVVPKATEQSAQIPGRYDNEAPKT